MLLFTGDCLGSGFGQSFGTVERLTQFADDSKSLVDHISSKYSPYERYSLRVYAGHAWQNGFGGPPGKDVERVDVGYLDWRFVQNMASCARGILAGKWLVEGSGLRYVGGKDQTDRWASQMVFGIGASRPQPYRTVRGFGSPALDRMPAIQA
ncbi:MAG: hypothetical protein EHM13_07815 [Acidobacteria bacterium]|nr:MAG: hypothetical protein EHM13_07815 [Acidobacteriota bacterium]